MQDYLFAERGAGDLRTIEYNQLGEHLEAFAGDDGVCIKPVDKDPLLIFSQSIVGAVVVVNGSEKLSDLLEKGHTLSAGGGKFVLVPSAVAIEWKGEDGVETAILLLMGEKRNDYGIWTRIVASVLDKEARKKGDASVLFYREKGSDGMTSVDASTVEEVQTVLGLDRIQYVKVVCRVEGTAGAADATTTRGLGNKNGGLPVAPPTHQSPSRVTYRDLSNPPARVHTCVHMLYTYAGRCGANIDGVKRRFVVTTIERGRAERLHRTIRTPHFRPSQSRCTPRARALEGRATKEGPGGREEG